MTRVNQSTKVKSLLIVTCTLPYLSHVPWTLSPYSQTPMPTDHDDSNSTFSSPSDDAVPRGFSLLRGPDGRHYLVPDFLVVHTKLAWESARIREELGSDSVTRGVGAQFSCRDRHPSHLLPTSRTRQETIPASHLHKARSRCPRTRWVFHYARE